MTVFEFLKVISEEQFPFTIEYVEWNKSLKVTVDTFSKTEIYHFDTHGVISHESFIEESSTEDTNVIEKKIEDLRNRPVRMWLKAAEDLGVKFISPYKFIGINNQEYTVDGLLPEFGYGKGVLITSRHTDDEAVTMADISSDYMLTGLSPKYYDTYDRQHLIETLSEWGWIGEKKPDWLIENKEVF